VVKYVGLAKQLLATNWNEALGPMWLFQRTRLSTVYNNTGEHFSLNNSSTTSLLAILSIFPNIALKLRYTACLAYLNEQHEPAHQLAPNLNRPGVKPCRVNLMPNIYTRQLSCVGVGGVYWALHTAYTMCSIQCGWIVGNRRLERRLSLPIW